MRARSTSPSRSFHISRFAYSRFAPPHHSLQRHRTPPHSAYDLQRYLSLSGSIGMSRTYGMIGLQAPLPSPNAEIHSRYTSRASSFAFGTDKTGDGYLLDSDIKKTAMYRKKKTSISRIRDLGMRAMMWGVVITISYYVGKVSSNGGVVASEVDLSVAGLPLRLPLPPILVKTAERCDPYSQLGALVVDPKDNKGNYWAPISSDCNATDYLDLGIQQRTMDELEFMRGRTVVLMGDSIDRGNLVDTCDFIGGQLETVYQDSPLTTPLPPGREIPVGPHDRLGAPGNGWADSEESRPHICTVERYQFRMINFFHYGFQSEDDPVIVQKAHYYPPGRIEDRIDQIVVPMLQKISQLKSSFASNASPDLFSISPGFWHILRQVAADDARREQLLAAGHSSEELRHLEDGTTPSRKRREAVEVRMVEVLNHIADAFPATVENGVSWKPTIVWRTLNHIKYQHSVPTNHVSVLDAIGRRVVEQVLSGNQRQGRLANFIARVKPGKRPVGLVEEEERAKDLAGRLVLDPWGGLLLGQEMRYRDNMHPMPLPAGRLYGNMMLDRLRRVVESRAERK